MKKLFSIALIVLASLPMAALAKPASQPLPHFGTPLVVFTKAQAARMPACKRIIRADAFTLDELDAMDATTTRSAISRSVMAKRCGIRARGVPKSLLPQDWDTVDAPWTR